ncbi:probable serine/threonine-protein kinase kinX [Eurosta solidaginis]|uniref:probable serine/threonine-protein kinase kinX n=1 Tax=Eurosta solidaginis TaxID=178769 RepID=UPI003530F1AD
MGVRIFNCCIVLLTVLYVSLGASDAAVIKRDERSLSVYLSEHLPVRVARQAYSDEDSNSAENDGDEVREQELAQQQLDEAAQYDSDEDDDDDDDNDRRRREAPAAAVEIMKQTDIQETESVAVPKPLPAPPATNAQINAAKVPTSVSESSNTPSTTPATTSPNTSVLILIRDALKKVTTLPTEQVATNALQYFQLFEHFLQQTIEEVISDDDDDEVETEDAAATTKPDATFTPEEEEVIAGVEEILKEPELVTKQPLVEQPNESQVEEMMNEKPTETNTVNVVGQTKPVPGGPTIEGEKLGTHAAVSASEVEKDALAPNVEDPVSVKEPMTVTVPLAVKDPISMKEPAIIHEPFTNSV